MDLSDEEVGLSLSVTGYEFSGGGDSWDRNWLNTEGAVRCGDRRWAFTSPCLQAHEAQRIADWLESAASDAVSLVDDAVLAQAWDNSNSGRDNQHQVLTFMEPDLAFTLREKDDEFVVLRAHLAHAAADPELPDDDRMAEPPPWIQVRMSRQDLFRAAQAWRQELEPWPAR
jgi:hypothetical protein